MVLLDKDNQGSAIPIFLYPGAVFTSNRSHEVFTVLGSCASVCLWDKELKIGGINHFLLPCKHHEASDSPKFGDFATKLLIKKMLELGSCKEKLWAKVFGGANQLNKAGLSYQVGQLNVEMAFKVLKQENIFVINSHTGGNRGRKLRFNIKTGEAAMMIL